MSGTTRRLARYAVESDFQSLPEIVRHESVRAFVNWVGCALGGSTEPAVNAALAAVSEFSGPPEATVLGRRERLDATNAALVNCLGSSVHAFDDTHLATVTHPTGPVAAAALALAERRPVRGDEFLHSIVLGIELQCRMSNVLTAPPARCNLGLYMTGLTGAIGAAAAAGRLLRLDEQHMVWALGIGAIEGAGLRTSHATMCSGYVPAHAARNGLVAALLAAKGFTCSEESLEAPNGFAGVFGNPANLAAATEGLGSTYETLANAYKPFPCGIVIHPAIDACLGLARRHDVAAADIDRVELVVHPLALELTGRREPKTGFDAQVSLFHWVAACLIHRAAGLEQARDACVGDPRVVELRQRIAATSEGQFGRDEARARLILRNGRAFEIHVTHCRGSLANPMTDDELDRKFLAQADGVLSAEQATQLLAVCRNIEHIGDVGAEIRRVAAR